MAEEKLGDESVNRDDYEDNRDDEVEADSDDNSDEQSEPELPEDTSHYVRRSLRPRKKPDRWGFLAVNR